MEDRTESVQKIATVVRSLMAYSGTEDELEMLKFSL